MRGIYVNTRTLIEYFKKEEPSRQLNLDTIRDTLLVLTAEKLAEMRKGGVAIFQHVSRPCELLYVPMGWYGIESSMPGSALTYGIRKSWVTASNGDLEQYDASMELLRASDRSVVRMAAIRTPMHVKLSSADGSTATSAVAA